MEKIMNEAGLIERLEKATGPDRTLDAEIMFDIYAKPVGQHAVDGGPSGYLWPENDPSWSFGLRFPGRDRDWFKKGREHHEETLLIERDGALVLMNSLRVPELTASLDAAMSLVPEGARVATLKELVHAPGWKDERWYWNAALSVHPEYYSADGATAALALCIAALKALAKSRHPSPGEKR